MRILFAPSSFNAAATARPRRRSHSLLGTVPNLMCSETTPRRQGSRRRHARSMPSRVGPRVWRQSEVTRHFVGSRDYGGDMRFEDAEPVLRATYRLLEEQDSISA